MVWLVVVVLGLVRVSGFASLSPLGSVQVRRGVQRGSLGEACEAAVDTLGDAVFAVPVEPICLDAAAVSYSFLLTSWLDLFDVQLSQDAVLSLQYGGSLAFLGLSAAKSFWTDCSVAYPLRARLRRPYDPLESDDWVGDPNLALRVGVFVAERALKKTLVVVDPEDSVKADLLDNMFRGQRRVLAVVIDSYRSLVDSISREVEGSWYWSLEDLAQAIRRKNMVSTVRLIVDLRHCPQVPDVLRDTMKLKEIAGSKILTIVVVKSPDALRELPPDISRRLQVANPN